LNLKTTTAELIFDPDGQATKLIARISAIKRIHFVLALAGTEVSDIEFVSAAGATAAARRLTPSLDADALVSAPPAGGIPKSPEGIASPVVLARAALSFIPHKTTIVDCGSFVSPTVLHIKAGNRPAKSLAQACDALSSEEIKNLYQAGANLAKQLRKEEIVVLAECVPGGTTTAQAALMALGIEGENLLSSSLPVCNHMQKMTLSRSALAQAATRRNLNGNSCQYFQSAPLDIVAAVGDPMQAFAAGLVGTRSAEQAITVLAGGSQMLAVYAIAAQIAANDFRTLSGTLVATTRWVARDSTANTAALAQMIGAPYVASCLSLASSRHAGLRAYELGHVKEGVGAGAAMLLASLIASVEEKTLLATIDSFYSAMT